MNKKLKALTNGSIYYKEGIGDGLVIIFDDVIKKVICLEEFNSYNKEDYEIIDCNKNYIVPGFIDVHIHGYKSVDVMDGTIESLKLMQKELIKNGVTNFLATTMTMPQNEIEKTLDAVKTVMSEKTEFAEIIGVHLEGPFISETFKGAQKASHIIPPDKKLVEKYKDILKVVTIAPEADGALEMIEQYGDTINFSIGHSNATYKQAMEAIEKGAKSITHLFNGMKPLHHRDVGVIGCALTSDCYVEMIADTIHVSPDLYNFVIKTKSIEKLLLITDCTRAGDMADGEYDLGGQKFILKDGACRLEDGTLAGSILKLQKALKNLTELSNYDLSQTIKTVTENQAKYLGIYDRLGSLDVGKHSDIVVMDKSLNVISVFKKGDLKYSG